MKNLKNETKILIVKLNKNNKLNLTTLSNKRDEMMGTSRNERLAMFDSETLETVSSNDLINLDVGIYGCYLAPKTILEIIESLEKTNINDQFLAFNTWTGREY